MTVTISAFANVPEFARGYVRDMRVRWALEEAGWPYEQSLITMESKKEPQYRGWQPFGQVPAFRDDTVSLFESAAIVLYIAERSEALAPRDAAGRARVTTWVLAAIDSVEPDINLLAEADIFMAAEPFSKDLRRCVEPRVAKRLSDLAAWLGDREYLEDRFTAGDLMMAMVLRNVPPADIEPHAKVKAYRDRCLARPAFARALAAHMEAFELASAA